ncbi:unnamed protein product [Caenorhabditis auriculariae]|uniref:Major sperm protein n=1 Tax=Caenorhabditis auriculariae TaxID=2777116 RepID=A0A8S1HA55_9PELO|nr:unnamed protein product [Caenorhabditis auriculariae]
MLLRLTLLLLTSPWLSDTFVAYDRRNRVDELVTPPPDDVTRHASFYRPSVKVAFVNSEARHRMATRLAGGKVRIVQTPSKVVPVLVEDEKIQIRFGGGPKMHLPYPRVAVYQPSGPLRWHTEATEAPNFSAQPALYLPSRFHRNDANVVVVFKRKEKRLN